MFSECPLFVQGEGWGSVVICMVKDFIVQSSPNGWQVEWMITGEHHTLEGVSVQALGYMKDWRINNSYWSRENEWEMSGKENNGGSARKVESGAKEREQMWHFWGGVWQSSVWLKQHRTKGTEAPGEDPEGTCNIRSGDWTSPKSSEGPLQGF